MRNIETQRRAALPGDKLLRIKGVVERTQISKSTWWQGCRDGRFPAPIRNGRMTFWKSSDIDDFIAKMTEGTAE